MTQRAERRAESLYLQISPQRLSTAPSPSHSMDKHSLYHQVLRGLTRAEQTYQAYHRFLAAGHKYTILRRVPTEGTQAMEQSRAAVTGFTATDHSEWSRKATLSLTKTHDQEDLREPCRRLGEERSPQRDRNALGRRCAWIPKG